MDKELDDRLVAEFPNLYRNRYASPQVTCMCWGFPNNGWFELIYDLSAKLEELILQIPEEQRHLCCASQCKEKFGTLRFYMDGATAEMRALIRKAETASASICEECGENGVMRTGGWLRVLCDKHAKGRNPHKSTLTELSVVLAIEANEEEKEDE